MKNENKDMLASIFSMQAELNDYVFKKNHLKDRNGNTLNMQTVFAAVENGELMVNDLPNTWLANYARAMDEELKELYADLLWKWWSKDTIDIQNIRVELIDILHFLVSAMISAGLTPVCTAVWTGRPGPALPRKRSLTSTGRSTPLT